jgi:glutamate transport system substrate-binding protein
MTRRTAPARNRLHPSPGRGMRRIVPAALLAALVALPGCSRGTTSLESGLPAPPPDTIAKIHDAGTVRIGTKFDQPGLGNVPPGQSAPQGFDIEIAKIIAGRLGIAPDKIKWVETVSKNREKFIENGTVDLVLASYSITDGRRLVVGQAGPYFVTGQQVLVRKDDDSIHGPENLVHKRVCATSGSTSIRNVEENYNGAVVARPVAKNSDCVKLLLAGQIDAATTDGAILLGYASQYPDRLQVVGDTFTEERYGVGYPKGDTKLCTLIVNALTTAYRDGSWARAFRATLGKTGAQLPQPPSPDPCL